VDYNGATTCAGLLTMTSQRSDDVVSVIDVKHDITVSN